MVETKSNFNTRLRTLGRKHSAMANGYTPRVGADGLIVIKPKRAKARLPYKAILLAALGFIAFKAFMLASIGPDAYTDRVAQLNNGTVFEQGGAWVMQVDPATQFAADILGPTLR